VPDLTWLWWIGFTIALVAMVVGSYVNDRRPMWVMLCAAFSCWIIILAIRATN
jgi:hypothetical protein